MKQPINQNTTKEAGELLRFLYKIKSKHILSGQHNYISSGAKYMEKVTELTGKTPLVWGGDFGYCYKGDNPEEYQHSGPLNLTDPAEDAEFTGITPKKGRKNVNRGDYAEASPGTYHYSDVAFLFSS
jgi:hypothetical protein